MDEVFTTREAAEFLKIHEKTVGRLARDGRIPGNKIGGEWRFIKSDLVRWIRTGDRSPDSMIAMM
jgi:excisionase family DNA binding protein